MSTVTVAKQFQFHAAHRLPHHDGQCRRLHGHTYGLEVAVTGPSVPPGGGPDEGMVLDFMVLKDLYRMLIEPFVEHQNLNETMASPDLEVRYPLWTVIKQGEDPMEPKRVPLTTAEGLARWCLLNFEHGLYTLMDRSQLTYRIQVIVWETSTSYAKIGSEWRDNG